MRTVTFIAFLAGCGSQTPPGGTDSDTGCLCDSDTDPVVDTDTGEVVDPPDTDTEPCCDSGDTDTTGDTGTDTTPDTDTGPCCDTGDTGTVPDADSDGYTVEQGDCDDTISVINPSATDLVGDSIDQNCDGVDGFDGDHDLHASQVSGGDDCDDTDPLTFPSAPEVWYDGKAQGCQVGPTEAWDDGDQDLDGFDAVVVGGDDCDDLADSVHIGLLDEAASAADAIDDNCSGVADGFSVAVVWGSDPNIISVDASDVNVTSLDFMAIMPSAAGMVSVDLIVDPATSTASGTVGDGDFIGTIPRVEDSEMTFTLTGNFDGDQWCYAWGFEPLVWGPSCIQADPTTF